MSKRASSANPEGSPVRKRVWNSSELGSSYSAPEIIAESSGAKEESPDPEHAYLLNEPSTSDIEDDLVWHKQTFIGSRPYSQQRLERTGDMLQLAAGNLFDALVNEYHCEPPRLTLQELGKIPVTAAAIPIDISVTSFRTLIIFNVLSLSVSSYLYHIKTLQPYPAHSILRPNPFLVQPNPIFDLLFFILRSTSRLSITMGSNGSSTNISSTNPPSLNDPNAQQAQNAPPSTNITSPPNSSSNTSTAPPNPTIVPPAASTTRTTGFLAIPPKGHREAPTKFKGDHRRAQTFIDHLERLFTTHQVVLDRDRIDALIYYSSKRVVDVVKGFVSYAIPNWVEFRAQFLRFYYSDFNERKYKVRHIRRLTDKYHTKSFSKRTTWIKYLRDYTRIAGPLLNRGEITNLQNHEFFYHGLSTKLRRIVNRTLKERLPTHDRSVPWDQRDVEWAVDRHFEEEEHDFAKNLDNDGSDVDLDTESASDDSGDSSDSDDSSDESDHETKRRKKSKTSRTKSSSTSNQRPVSSPDTPPSQRASTPRHTTPTPSNNPNDLDMDEVIRKLSKMTLDDPDYAPFYVRALLHNSQLAQLFPAPKILAGTPPGPSVPNNFRNNTYMPPSNSTLAGRDAPRDNCWGCGSMEHISGKCPELNDLISKGELKRNEQWKITWPDGVILQRRRGETIMDAYRRQKASMAAVAAMTAAPITSSNFIQASQACSSVSYSYLVSPSATDDEIIQALEVHRTKKDKEATRPAPYRAADHPYETRAKPVKPPVPPPVPDTTIPSETSSIPSQAPPPQMPHDAIPDRVDTSTDDAIMEDSPEDSSTPVVTPPTKPSNSTKKSKNPKPANATRQSAVSSHIDKSTILNKILNASSTDKFDISIGEFLACSPYLANMLIESLL
ncbi:hypothetical protein D9758_017681 [Tetrapyrgos nigripes]|uniref:Uncharacterized protein n=1 Tax=Tetrapyrgos nigripes TaxID=182062 RepID=A0A8H5FGH4_9AGAR|nr:hypothetical protein D9758_017681 [Tetrapyrgos nigripes]